MLYFWSKTAQNTDLYPNINLVILLALLQIENSTVINKCHKHDYRTRTVTSGWIFSTALSLSPWSKNSMITRSAALSWTSHGLVMAAMSQVVIMILRSTSWSIDLSTLLTLPDDESWLKNFWRTLRNMKRMKKWEQGKICLGNEAGVTIFCSKRALLV